MALLNVSVFPINGCTINDVGERKPPSLLKEMRRIFTNVIFINILDKVILLAADFRSERPSGTENNGLHETQYEKKGLY